MKQITYNDVMKNEEFKVYVKKGNDLLGVMGYTDHSAAHTVKVAMCAAEILSKLNYSEEDIELVKIAGYVHDIGNMVNRIDHAQTGALMAFNILTRMEMPAEQIATIVGAIGNHDESTGNAVDPVSAALIIADKTDVRRSRVRNKDFSTFDIHDRVNYSVESSSLEVLAEEKKIQLYLTIDLKICSVLEYFEIFLSRMLMCKKASAFLGLHFEIVANGTIL